jgi:hypothetical protein
MLITYIATLRQPSIAPPYDDSFVLDYKQMSGDVFETNDRGHPTQIVLAGPQFGDGVLYHAQSNCSFISWKMTTGAPYYDDNIIMRYNHTTGRLDQLHDFLHREQTAYRHIRDYHCIAVMMELRDGRLLFANERSHNGTIFTWKTGTAGNLSSVVAKPNVPGGGAYPKLFGRPDSERIACVKRGPSTDMKSTHIALSDNLGETWFDSFQVTTIGSAETGDIRHYASQLIQPNDGVWRLLIQKRKSASGGDHFIEIYYIESHDGGYTWENINRTSAKNVRPNTSTAAPLTEAELQANYMVTQTAPPAVYGQGDTLDAYNGCIIPGGGVGFISGRGTFVNNTLGVRLHKWNGTQWTETPIVLAHPISRCIEFYAYTATHYSAVFGLSISGNVENHQYDTYDGGASWQLSEDLSKGRGAYPATMYTNSDYNAAIRTRLSAVRQPGEATADAVIQFKPTT